MAKITKATIKKFIKENSNSLLINVKSSFDGMTDGLAFFDEGFKKAKKDNSNVENTFGIEGAWFVGQSRDYFTAYETPIYIGYEIYNCCGKFILAIKK